MSFNSNGNITNSNFRELPTISSGYKYCDYLEASGAQYIDTGIKAITAPYVMSFKYYRNSTSTSDMSIFGERSLGKFVNTYSTYYETVLGNTSSGTLITMEDATMEIDSTSGIFLNGSKILNNSSSASRSGTNGAIMFGFIENSTSATPTWLFTGKIYYYIIRENNVLTHYFQPVLRSSDSKPGMLDVVTGIFYTNGGTGADFTYGLLSNVPTSVSSTLTTMSDLMEI